MAWISSSQQPRMPQCPLSRPSPNPSTASVRSSPAPLPRRSTVAVTGRATSRMHGVDIVFAGTPDAAVPALEAFAESEHRIRAVLTRPDAPIGRRRVLTPSPVKTRALELGLDVIEAE